MCRDWIGMNNSGVWSWWSELNRRLAGFYPAHPYAVELRAGLEPATCGLRNRCSTIELPQRVRSAGLLYRRVHQLGVW